MIHDLLGDEGRREVTLLAGARILRRRRQRRAASQVSALALILAVAALWLGPDRSRQTARRVPTPATSPAPSGASQSLTDDELLALFPTNTPVGLATLADGKKRLIFPHPGDEKRFVIHL